VLRCERGERREFGEEPQHQISILLQQLVLPPVAPIRCGIAQMLRAIQFHRHARVVAQEIRLQRSHAVERDG
jgi:hypothetical protein